MQDFLKLPEQGQALTQGVSPGLYAPDGFFWYDGENLVFRDNGVFAMSGKLLAVGVDAVALAQIALPDQQRLYYATTESVWWWNGSRSRLIAEEVAVDLQPYGTFLAYSDRVNSPKLWKNGVVEDLGLGLAVQKLAKLGPHLIAFGVGEAQDSARWASADAPQDWTIDSAVNSAGELTLRELGGPIIAAEKLGPDYAVYTRDAMGLFAYIGAPFYFGFNARLSTIGAVGPTAVVPVGGKNYGIGRQGVWTTDGVQYDYIDVPAMQAYLQENINWDAAAGIVGYHNEVDRTIEWYYPHGESTTNTRGVSYNYSNGAWSRFSFGAKAALERNAFSWPFISRGGGVYFQGAEAEAAEESWVQSKPLHFGDEERFKRLQELRFGVRGTLSCQIGAQDVLEGAIDWYSLIEAVSSLDTPSDREAVYFSFKLFGRGWKLSAMKARGQVGGWVV